MPAKLEIRTKVVTFLKSLSEKESSAERMTCPQRCWPCYPVFGFTRESLAALLFSWNNLATHGMKTTTHLFILKLITIVIIFLMQTVSVISLTWEIQKENNGRKGHSTFQMGNAKCQHAAVQCYCEQYPIVQDRLMARDRG